MSYLLLLALAFGADEVPLVELPTEVRAKPGRMIRLVVKTNGKVVKWSNPSDDCDLIEFPDGKTAIFSAAIPGRYRVIAYTALGDQPSEPAICTILVGEVPPPPVPPGPNPPTPPTPPGPVDPLTAKLQKAFEADVSDPAKKTEWKKALVGFFAAMGEHAAKPSIKTLGDLLADYRDAIPTLLPDGSLVELRKLCGLEVAALIGEDSSPDRELVAVFRQQLSDGFKRISKALEGVK